jgi:hypothetical protein
MSNKGVHFEFTEDEHGSSHSAYYQKFRKEQSDQNSDKSDESDQDDEHSSKKNNIEEPKLPTNPNYDKDAPISTTNQPDIKPWVIGIYYNQDHSNSIQIQASGYWKLTSNGSSWKFTKPPEGYFFNVPKNTPKKQFSENYSKKYSPPLPHDLTPEQYDLCTSTLDMCCFSQDHESYSIPPFLFFESANEWISACNTLLIDFIHFLRCTSGYLIDLNGYQKILSERQLAAYIKSTTRNGFLPAQTCPKNFVSQYILPLFNQFPLSNKYRSVAPNYLNHLCRYALQYYRLDIVNSLQLAGVSFLPPDVLFDLAPISVEWLSRTNSTHVLHTYKPILHPEQELELDKVIGVCSSESKTEQNIQFEEKYKMLNIPELTPDYLSALPVQPSVRSDVSLFNTG